MYSALFCCVKHLKFSHLIVIPPGIHGRARQYTGIEEPISSRSQPAPVAGGPRRGVSSHARLLPTSVGRRSDRSADATSRPSVGAQQAGR